MDQKTQETQTTETTETTQTAATDQSQQTNSSNESGAATNQAGENGTRPKWMNQLTGDLKENEKLTGFATIGDLAEAMLKSDGTVAVTKPGDDASDEDVAAYREAAGIPANPDGYEIAKPQLPEGMEFNQGLEDHFRRVFHDNDVSNDLAGKLNDEFNKIQISQHNAIIEHSKAEMAKCETALREKWGNDFEANDQLGRRAFVQFASPELAAFFEQSQLGSNPLMMEFFHDIGIKMGEGSLVGGAAPKPEQSTGLDYSNTQFE